MSTATDLSSPPQDSALRQGNEHQEGGHHVDPLWLYLVIFGGLLVMTVVTVGASFIDFGAANTIIAVIIATIKASLVAVFFMHLRHDKPFHALVLVSGLLFLSFLFLFTLSDDGTRNNVDPMHGKPVEKTPAVTATSPAPGAASGNPSGGHTQPDTAQHH